MIYGDPITIGGGGGGGFDPSDALIHVNAPYGSTVTLSKGGVTVKVLTPADAFPNVDGTTADYYYSVTASNYGTWDATATLSGKTASGTVSVSAAEQYNIELSYRFYIIKNGIVPSGVTLDRGLRTGYPVTITENYNGLGYLRVVTYGSYAGGFVTQALDLSQYASAVLDYALEATYGALDFAVYPNNRYSTIEAARAAALSMAQATMAVGRNQLDMDVSSIVTSCYPGILRATANYNNMTVLIFNMWLE